MNKYIAEFIGTFFLVFTIGCCVIAPGAGAMAPVAIGIILMVMVYAGGHVSGAHFNPAVTLAAHLRGRCDARDAVSYIAFQCVGAVAAALAVKFLKPADPVTAMTVATMPALVAEFLLTFALAYVVLNVATSKDHPGNSFYGFAIGGTVMAGAYAVGGVSGGVFNPAVAVGISIMGLSPWANIWIYLVANLAGGAVAAIVFKILNPTDT